MLGFILIWFVCIGFVKVSYRQAIGSLLYLATTTRPDISFPVSAPIQFNNNPGTAHWYAVKRLLRYLKGSQDSNLTFRKSGKSLYGCRIFSEIPFATVSKVDARFLLQCCLFKHCLKMIKVDCNNVRFPELQMKHIRYF